MRAIFAFLLITAGLACDEDTLFVGTWEYTETKPLTYLDICPKATRSGSIVNKYYKDFDKAEFHGSCNLDPVDFVFDKAAGIHIQIIGDSLATQLESAFLCELEHLNMPSSRLVRELGEYTPDENNYDVSRRKIPDSKRHPGTITLSHIFSPHLSIDFPCNISCELKTANPPYNISIPAHTSDQAGNKWILSPNGPPCDMRNGALYCLHQEHAFDGTCSTCPDFELDLSATAIIIGSGAWHPSQRIEEYKSKLRTIAPLLQHAVNQGLVVIWNPLPPTCVPLGSETLPNLLPRCGTELPYNWESFVEFDATAFDILGNLAPGVKIFNTSAPLMARKNRSEKFSFDGLHWSNPGPSTATEFLMHRYLYHIVQTIDSRKDESIDGVISASRWEWGVGERNLVSHVTVLMHGFIDCRLQERQVRTTSPSQMRWVFDVLTEKGFSVSLLLATNDCGLNYGTELSKAYAPYLRALTFDSCESSRAQACHIKVLHS